MVRRILLFLALLPLLALSAPAHAQGETEKLIPITLKLPGVT